MPGLVRAADGLVRNAPHLHWTDAPIRDLVERATGLPTVVGNDASLGAIAEHLYGAARGIDDVVYLNGGASGIGGGLIVHGMPVAGAGGYAGEFGQNRPGIASDRRPPRARRRARGRGEPGAAAARSSASRPRTNPRSPRRSPASDDSRRSTAELARQRGILATALANAVNVLNPSVVVLGGFLATIAEHDLGGLTAAVAATGDAGERMEGLDIRVAVPRRGPPAHRRRRGGVRRRSADPLGHPRRR